MSLKEERLAGRSDRQAQRQGFLAGLAPQILDKIPGASADDSAGGGYDEPLTKQGGGEGAGTGALAGLQSGGMMLPLIIVGAVLLMKKKK